MRSEETTANAPDETNALERAPLKSMEDVASDRATIAAFQRGDANEVVRCFLAAHIDTDASERKELALVDIARFAIAVRRRDIAVLGAHDSFVRLTPSGSLRQVVNRVQLRLDDDSLYQIPVWKKDPQSGRWGSMVEDPTKATVSYSGLLRCNATAGCAIGMPPSVMVDGQERTNPYRKLTDKGDIERIVVTVNVVGAAPMTGNPTMVQYTLDVDPRKDLQHMLGELTKKKEMTNGVFLIEYDQWLEHREDMEPLDRRRWAFLPLFAGIGIAHDLRLEDVRKAYIKHVNLSQNALKKAITVARRNAMKAHPALAFHTVRVDGNGRAYVGVIGWAAETGDLGRYMALMDSLSKGVVLPDVDVDVETIEAEYEPVEHNTGDPELDAVVDDDTDADAVRADDPDVAVRNGLLGTIDEGITMVSPAFVNTLDYRPDEQTVWELQAVLAKINNELDQQESGQEGGE